MRATVKDRSGRAKAAIFEVRGIADDYRMHKAGGLLGAFDIWEMAIVQALLNNSETWLYICEDSVKDLEEIQNLFLRVVLDVPASTPKPALL